MAAAGLVHLNDHQLERLLKAVVKGYVSCPLTPDELMTAGLSDVFDRVSALRGLDQRAVTAVLVAVLAERRAAARRP